MLKYWQSVRVKIAMGFILIIVPMIAFIIYNNLYAMKIVRQQVSANYNNLLTVNARENDKILLEFVYYLLRLQQNDPDIAILKNPSSSSSDYTLAKTRLKNSFIGNSEGINYNIDSLFVYPRQEDSVFLVTKDSGDLYAKKKEVREWIARTLEKRDTSYSTQWEMMQIGDIAYLLKTLNMGSGVYAGVLVRVENMMRGLEGFDVGSKGKALLMDRSGKVLTDPGLLPLEEGTFRNKISSLGNDYALLKQGGDTYLALSKASIYSDLNYVIVIPEDYVLQNLPFFQKMLYVWIPLLVAIVLSLYILFLQRVMFKPLTDLIRGMRKIGQGKLEVRMPTNQSSEFAFMAGTFNQMAGQIEKLKIEVYEEQLRVQKAEYKHLQIQINPHFYMNCLNIIYNLAALKDYKSVQKLSLHLADYFRFLMQSHRSVVRLEDEISHIKHYLEIHKLRYVEKLDYEIEIDREYLRRELSPLMIQPFVENSIIHGFNGRVQDGSQFMIKVRSEDDLDDPQRYVRIVVEDNGAGFPKEMLRDIESGVYLSGTGEQHLGIWNILRRFKMLYGDDGSINFSNRPEGGARVEIKLPLLHNSAVDQDDLSVMEVEKEDSDADDASRR
ncbi:MAG: histidine kinase [Candidatus Cohnella colombiensis]|uniref:Histidine kinase n=1 Tax=Candidatus Cohnella colombiensis TaxID=3121368 RepID=A0AA95JC71_9BACL|nr:MAG: histidine kinase [Cohnella sp.]